MSSEDAGWDQVWRWQSKITLHALRNPGVICRTCGALMPIRLRGNPRRFYCSATCKERMRRRRWRMRKLLARYDESCLVCGSHFTTCSPNSRDGS